MTEGSVISIRILLVHNFYQWPGGEDQVFAAEGELLEQHGHVVSRYTLHNDEVVQLGKASLAGKTLWNASVYRELTKVCRDLQPDVVHFHNTFPLVSPAAYYAVRRQGIGVVQTLHNYRLICPGTTLFRSGSTCEACVGSAIPWRSVAHRCYRNSVSASAGAALLGATHRLARTWTRAVDRYIAPSDFVRDKFVEGGFPAGKIVTKPHFVPADPGAGEHRGGYGLFVGRLSDEKGIRVLMEACTREGATFPIKIVGDGPLAPLLNDRPPHVEWVGQQSKAAVMQLMKDASFLIFPSECYETFGLTIVEAFATGLPVIGSGAGAAAELIDDDRTGLHFELGDADDLARKLEWAEANPEAMAILGAAARREYLERYTAERNYRLLMDIYEEVVGTAQPGGTPNAAVPA